MGNFYSLLTISDTDPDRWTYRMGSTDEAVVKNMRQWFRQRPGVRRTKIIIVSSSNWGDIQGIIDILNSRRPNAVA